MQKIIILLQVLSLSTIARTKELPHTLLLNDGNRIPMISFGTMGNTDIAHKVLKSAVIQAIEAGYRQIDTAAAYKTEELVGEAITDVISRGLVTRQELWITTKLHPNIGTRDKVLTGLQASLRKLKLDYIDLFLVHSPDNFLNIPVHNYLEVWKGMEDVKKLNLSRSIGVSNFNKSHINELLTNSEIVPSVNEIEVNPTFTNEELVRFCQSKNITVLSYAPLGFTTPRLFSLKTMKPTFLEPVLVEIAKKYGKMPNQVIIRYLINRGTIPIPKSIKPEHIKMNIDVFDFQLTADEVEAINRLNKDFRVYYFDKTLLDKFIKYYNL